MARTNNLTDFLTDVSSAIKQKTGDSSPIPASEFDTEILSIETAGNYQSKILNITQNGNYNLLPDQEFDAISNVNISVSVSPVLQNKTITENGSYTADQNYDGLGTVIVNVPQTGDVPVKLFETQEEMQADETAKEGDLAVVYRSEVQNATVDSKFQIATFPETVVLDNAITDSVEVRYRAVDSSVMFDCWGSLDSSMFRMDCYSESGEIRIEYTSSDGITYTRTRMQGNSGNLENPVDFGTEIYYEMAEMWNDAIGKFIQVGGSTFEGLYEYGPYIDTTSIQLPLVSGITIDTTNKNYSWDGSLSEELSVASIGEMVNIICDAEGYIFNRMHLIIGQNDKPALLFSVNTKNATQSYMSIQYELDNSRYSVQQAVNGTYKNLVYELNLTDKTYTKVDLGTTSSGGSSPWYNTFDYEPKSFLLMLYTSNDGIITGNMSNISNQLTCISSSTSWYYRNENLPKTYFVARIGYLFADTQLTMSNVNELLPGKIAYGKNGIITGDGSIYNVLDIYNVYNNTFRTNISKSIIANTNDNGKFSIVNDINVNEGGIVYINKTDTVSDRIYNKKYKPTSTITGTCYGTYFLDGICYAFYIDDGKIKYTACDDRFMKFNDTLIDTGIQASSLNCVISIDKVWYIVAGTNIYRYYGDRYDIMYSSLNAGTANYNYATYYREVAMFHHNGHIIIKNAYITSSSSSKSTDGTIQILDYDLSSNTAKQIYTNNRTGLFYIYNKYFKCSNTNFDMDADGNVWITTMEQSDKYCVLVLLKYDWSKITKYTRTTKVYSKDSVDCMRQVIKIIDGTIYCGVISQELNGTANFVGKFVNNVFTDIVNWEGYGRFCFLPVDDTYVIVLIDRVYDLDGQTKGYTPYGIGSSGNSNWNMYYNADGTLITTNIGRPDGTNIAECEKYYSTSKVSIDSYASGNLVDIGWCYEKSDLYNTYKSCMYLPIANDTELEIYPKQSAGPITQEEYSTAIDTANEILGEEV